MSNANIRAAVAPAHRSPYEAMTVTVPEGTDGALRVERFTVPENSAERLRLAMQGRDCPAGTYTRLMEGRAIWMSDTPAEKRDHMEALRAISRLQARRVLVNGLGIGMVIAAALTFECVEHVDVVERDERVIRLVGPAYAGNRVTIHHADAFEQARRWVPGTRWDCAWHDIWPDMCEDNLPQMTRLHRSYGGRVTWQGSWGREFLLRQRQRSHTSYGWYR